MKKIAIITENYEHDGKAMKLLMEKKFQQPDFEIFPILKAVKGSKLSNLVKFKKLLNAEIARRKKIDVVVIAIDLDGLPFDEKKIKAKLDWYENFKKITSLKNELFLMIYELESLILADIETFNLLYKSKIVFKGNPLFQANPKEFLIEKTRNLPKRYNESSSPEIFNALDFHKVFNNHTGEISFQSFIINLQKLLE